MYSDASMHDENGDWQMIFGLNTLPDYQRKGYAAKIMNAMIHMARQEKRKGLVLTCKDRLVPYYSKFRFKNLSAEEIKTTFLKETIDGEKTVQKSDDLILCLVQTPKNSPLPNGAYSSSAFITATSQFFIKIALASAYSSIVP